MANSTFPFPVDDTSPSILYLPLRDTFSTVNLTAGWNPVFSDTGFMQTPGETGVGTSFHATSLDDATISITWRGTGIQLLGYTTNQAGYEITLDGISQAPRGVDEEAGILVAFHDLANSAHNISLSTRIPADETPGTSKVFFDSAQIISTVNAPSSNIAFDLQPVNDRNISFLGQWSFHNRFNESYHHSVIKGDVAQVTFSGASFFLNGVTSPGAGTYSVVLDNVKSTLSGRSSFSNPNSLLFFATGLDPFKPHDVQVINEDGGELSLKVGGFKAYAVESSTALPSSSPLPSITHPKGTIAALVLAGILGFIVISGSLFFFFVVRPRRRRARQARMERRRIKEQEAGNLGVLNIAPPDFGDDLELQSAEAFSGHQAQRSNGKSGFARWKKEVEGGFGTLQGLGISFRHSGSAGRGASAKSSIFTLSSRLSSKRSHGKGKRKAKPKQVSESSWSASFALELPVRPESSADSFKDKDVGPSRLSPEGQPPLTSELTSLEYMNTPPPPAAKLSPPSYSIASSNGHSNPNAVSPSRSIPRSVSQSTLSSSADHSRQRSAGLLSSHRKLKSDSPEENKTHIYEPFRSPAQPLSAPDLLSPLAPRDRGSAQYSSDDATSVLGSAAARLAIRGLSPRTSEYPEPLSSGYRRDRKPRKETAPNRTNDPPDVLASAESGSTPLNAELSFLDVTSLMNRPITIPAPEPKDKGSPQVPDSAFLDVRPASPFMVDFTGSSSRKNRSSGHTGSIAGRKSDERSSETKQPLRNVRSAFHSTPPNNPPTSEAHGHARNQSTSFLDFSSSSDGSYRTQSIAPSEYSAQSRHRQPQSRWSNTLTQSTNLTQSNSSGVSVPVSSPALGPAPYFPYPTSLPPSPHHPEGHISSPSRQSILPQIEPRPTDRYPARALRLSAFGSPTDSVPMSVTESKLRHSTSTGESQSAPNSSQLPPHPPLPETTSADP
ncbi:hypothetical protein D9615_002628 [Tricholomella constricta]|uniref:Uncharacterized protein n=1 Tax=Tricholomella constricta TaxID=117010 RepID=A0A8H5M9X7_9AGAR|nr:hypothetical protein D9615_002628 [Tricholomella constricta]